MELDRLNRRSVAERSEATGSSPERSDGVSTREPSRPKRISQLYGEEMKKFEWTFKVDALPIPAKRASPAVKAHGYRDAAIKRFLGRVFRDLRWLQDHRHGIEYAFALETGDSGWRHPHVLLGNLSRVTPAEVEDVFREHGFGKVRVEVWNRALEDGYIFKSLDRATSPGDDYAWETTVRWNKECRNRMKMCRRHASPLVDVPSERAQGLRSRVDQLLRDSVLGSS